MNMYDVMYEAICDKYEHGEITLEEAEMLNDTAYDKYIVETSKETKAKRYKTQYKSAKSADDISKIREQNKVGTLDYDHISGRGMRPVDYNKDIRSRDEYFDGKYPIGAHKKMRIKGRIGPDSRIKHSASIVKNNEDKEKYFKNAEKYKGSWPVSKVLKDENLNDSNTESIGHYIYRGEPSSKNHEKYEKRRKEILSSNNKKIVAQPYKKTYDEGRAKYGHTIPEDEYLKRVNNQYMIIKKK